MNETHLSWDDLRLFLGVAEATTLAGAAKTTGASPPTLGRRMDRLEKTLGVRLFQRHARGYDLTEHGASVLERVQQIEQRVFEVEQNAALEVRPETIRISAGTWMTSYMTEKIGQLRDPKDQFQIYLSAEERRVDIARREALIGFRSKRPEEPNLVTRRLGHVAYAIYASDETVDGWIEVGANTPSAHWARHYHAAPATIGASTPTVALQLCIAAQGRMGTALLYR